MTNGHPFYNHFILTLMIAVRDLKKSDMGVIARRRRRRRRAIYYEYIMVPFFYPVYVDGTVPPSSAASIS